MKKASKEIRDINDRLAAVAESSGAYGSDERDVTELSTAEVEKLVAQLEAEMKNAAKQLEFERAAALRDEIQDIRIRVLEQDASVAVLRDAERAARQRGPADTPTAWPNASMVLSAKAPTITAPPVVFTVESSMVASRLPPMVFSA